MKRSFLRSLPAVAVMLFALPALAQNKGVAVNNDGRAPNPFAILDVGSYYPGAAIQKGMLIPRMTYAQRTSAALGLPGVLPQGLTVYQTDLSGTFPPGFYVVEYGQWFRLDNGADSWSINGNNLGTPANDYFGTRDDQDLVFRTNNAQVMRVEGTPGTRYVHIGTNTTVPNEFVDVGSGSPSTGALRIFNPPPGTWAGTNPNIKFAATNTQGTIMFRPSGTGSPGDSLSSTFLPAAPQNRDIVMWNGHWGNIDGTAPANLALADANAGGWNRLENEYEERFTKAYTQQGTPTCGTGSAELSFGSTSYSNTLPAATALLMNPFKFHVPQSRWRVQYMFLPGELNVETNQLGSFPTATGGLCAGSPLTTIGFWVNQAIVTENRNWQVVVTVKHAPLGTVNLNLSFDNSNDPQQGCYVSNALNAFPTAGPAGWRTFPALTPFVWDGQRPVIVEIAASVAAGGGGVLPGGLPVRYSNTGVNLTYASYAVPAQYGIPGSVCTPNTPTFNTCGPLNVATNLNTCGTFGPSIYRPVVQFGGTVATAPAATSGNNSFIWYNGGFISESTTSPNPWGRQTVPYFAFRGPGTISAENGVYDNGTKLNDHVFDRAFDGAVKPADAETFGTVRNLDIQEMADQTRSNRHLPTMKGRDSWRAERGFSLGDLTNQLWTTAETQALYMTELNDKLNVLELLSNDRPLNAAECELAKGSIRTLPGYTEAEKAVLLNTIDQRTVTTNQR